MTTVRGYVVFWVFLLAAASLYWGLLSTYDLQTKALRSASSKADSLALELLMSELVKKQHDQKQDNAEDKKPLTGSKEARQARHTLLLEKKKKWFEFKNAQAKVSQSSSVLDVNPPLRKIPHDNQTVPDLFMQRLNRLLPDCPPDKPLCDDHIRLFPDDVAKMEQEILAFDIPHKTIIKFPDSEYISIQYWRWLNQIDKGKMCPNCELRHNSGVFKQWNQLSKPGEKAHALYYFGCSFSGKIQREHKEQVLLGACGESQAGSGIKFFEQHFKKFDYDGSFHDRQAHQAGTRNQTHIDLDMEPEDTSESNLFTRTYLHMHFSPDNQHGFPELRNVTLSSKMRNGYRKTQ